MTGRLVVVLMLSVVMAGTPFLAQETQIRILPGQGQPSPGRPQMPARDAAPEPTGTAVIRGRVVAADLGTPLRRAQVRLSSAEVRVMRMTSTDGEGRYEFRDLPAARYNLQASKGGYVSVQHGQRRVLEAGRPIQLGDGQVQDKVDVVLPRGGVIAGRITDEFGEPVADAMVHASTYRYISGRRRLAPAGPPRASNDIGEYRLFGLPPGEYYLSAVARSMSFGDSQSDDTSGYAPTYYPGTVSIAEAQRISVGVGLEAHADFMLIPTRTARITGVVVDSAGKPYAGGMIMVMPANPESGMMFGAGGSPIKPDGSFSISNLAPGEYILNVRPMGGPMGEGEFASVPVTVSGADMTGLTIRTGLGATVRGRIVTDGGAPTFRPEMVRVMATPAAPDPGPIMGRAPSQAKEDWTFELRGLSGKCLFRATSPPGWMLKAVHLDGVDITDTPTDLTGVTEVTGLEITLTNRLTHVTGGVTDDRGAALKDYSVVVFATDPERWGGQSRFLRSARPDQDGRFQIQGLPAGEYFAVAVEYIQLGDWMDPEVLEQLRFRATRFSLGDGENRNLDLRLSTS
jgi:hypothetical protein